MRNSLDVEGGGAVIGVGPGVEFQIVDGGIFRIEANYDCFTDGQFACGEVTSFWFAGEILVPASRETKAIGVLEVVGKGRAEIVAAAGAPLPFNVDTGDDAVGCRPG